MIENEYIRPPGCYYDILPHPVDVNRAMEVAVVQDHRFAFFFWLKWKNRLGMNASSPSLVSLDWHEDLAAPGRAECEELRGLNKLDYRSAAFFCWDRLNPQNDGHILAAAFLDLIGDIFVVRKQDGSSGDHFDDINGKPHLIRCFDSVDELLHDEALLSQSSVFFDIDLDFFTESSDPCGGGDPLHLVSDEEIGRILSHDGKLVSWVLPRIEGMTIATEPQFCGGFINSNKLFAAATNALFDPQLLSSRPNWVHLRGA